MSEEMVAKPLVGWAFQAIELSSRTSSGESGIGRRRRSVRWPPSLLGEVPRRPGDGAAGVGGVGWIDRERHQYRSMVRAAGLPAEAHQRKGPCSSYLRGPFSHFRPLPVVHPSLEPARRPTAGPRAVDVHDWDAELRCRSPTSTGAAVPVDGGPISVEERWPSCGRHAGTRSMSRKGPETPCGSGVPGHRTLLTHFLRGERDRSETKIRTMVGQLAGRGSRRPGDGGRRGRRRRLDRPGASPVPVDGEGPRACLRRLTSGRALVAHTYEGPSPISRTDRSIFQSRRPTAGGCWASHR